jgi:hypothetical protein
MGLPEDIRRRLWANICKKLLNRFKTKLFVAAQNNYKGLYVFIFNIIVSYGYDPYQRPFIITLILMDSKA